MSYSEQILQIERFLSSNSARKKINFNPRFFNNNLPDNGFTLTEKGVEWDSRIKTRLLEADDTLPLPLVLYCFGMRYYVANGRMYCQWPNSDVPSGWIERDVTDISWDEMQNEGYIFMDLWYDWVPPIYT